MKPTKDDIKNPYIDTSELEVELEQKKQIDYIQPHVESPSRHTIIQSYEDLMGILDARSQNKLHRIKQQNEAIMRVTRGEGTTEDFEIMKNMGMGHQWVEYEELPDGEKWVLLTELNKEVLDK